MKRRRKGIKWIQTEVENPNYGLLKRFFFQDFIISLALFLRFIFFFFFSFSIGSKSLRYFLCVHFLFFFFIFVLFIVVVICYWCFCSMLCCLYILLLVYILRFCSSTTFCLADLIREKRTFNIKRNVQEEIENTYKQS